MATNMVEQIRAALAHIADCKVDPTKCTGCVAFIKESPHYISYLLRNYVDAGWSYLE